MATPSEATEGEEEDVTSSSEEGPRWFGRQMRESVFCLVLRGDTTSSLRFFHAGRLPDYLTDTLPHTLTPPPLNRHLTSSIIPCCCCCCRGVCQWPTVVCRWSFRTACPVTCPSERLCSTTASSPSSSERASRHRPKGCGICCTRCGPCRQRRRRRCNALLCRRADTSSTTCPHHHRHHRYHHPNLC